MLFLLTQLFERANRRNLLGDRPVLSDEEIYNCHYRGSSIPKSIITEKWHTIADILHVDPGRLRPDDRLEDLVCLPRWVADLAWSDIEDLEYLANLQRDITPPESINTIDELVRFLSSKHKT